ncbi:MAG: 16S rRNA (guanine(966)-N(2))-methyltransferase RsmD [Acidobacteriia bacterium]|nr:16S rRNA (guanine(966)-N(2))-methyltransferase RsmD [Terriglobia bacterium]
MRVIAGEFRSRRLKTPPGQDVRPTPDRLRESLFSILSTQIAGVVFADLYAGCGSVGIEALSRGASKCIFVERGRQASAVLKENLASLGVAGRAQVIQGNASTYAASLAAEIVFLDPPFDRTEEYDKTLSQLGERTGGIVIAQHASRFPLGEQYGRLRRYRQLRQGDNTLSFFVATAPAGEASVAPASLERAIE